MRIVHTPTPMAESAPIVQPTSPALTVPLELTPLVATAEPPKAAEPPTAVLQMLETFTAQTLKELKALHEEVEQHSAQERARIEKQHQEIVALSQDVAALRQSISTLTPKAAEKPADSVKAPVELVTVAPAAVPVTPP